MRWEIPAKVNWTLRVLGKRPDGFHELRSWFVPIDWCDALDAEPLGAPAAESRLEVVAEQPLGGVPAGADNLVLRAERAWRAAGGRAPALSWRLHKHIPAGAGLGGGSADAAGALCALEEFASRPLGLRQCEELAATLGSDVPFFFSGEGAELRGGRGERFLRRTEVPEAWLVLALAPIPVSTAAVYGALDAPLWSEPEPVADPTRGRPGGPGGDARLPAEPGPNDLAAAACAVHPELAAFARKLAEHGRFLMSGSGGSHFAACGSRADAGNLCAALERAGIAARAVRPRSGAVIREEVSWR